MRKIVNYEMCKTCKHMDKEEHEEPCNQCLTEVYNIDSTKPIYYEPRTKNNS